MFEVDNYGLYRALTMNPYSYVDAKGDDENKVSRIVVSYYANAVPMEKGLPIRKHYYPRQETIGDDIQSVAKEIIDKVTKAASEGSQEVEFVYMSHNDSFIVERDYLVDKEESKRVTYGDFLMKVLDIVKENKDFLEAKKKLKFNWFYWQACNTAMNYIDDHKKIFDVFDPDAIYLPGVEVMMGSTQEGLVQAAGTSHTEVAMPLYEITRDCMNQSILDKKRKKCKFSKVYYGSQANEPAMTIEDVISQ